MMRDDQVKFGRLTVGVEQDGDLWRLTASSEGGADPFSSSTYPSEAKAVAGPRVCTESGAVFRDWG